MNHNNPSLEDTLEICLERIEAGESLKDCLEDYPHHAAELESLLKLAVILPQFLPPPPTALQLQHIEGRLILPPRPRLVRYGWKVAAGIGLLLIILVGYGVSRPDSAPDSSAAVIQPTETDSPIRAASQLPTTTPPPLPTRPPTETATQSPSVTPTLSPTWTPPVFNTDTPSPSTAIEDENLLPIFVEFNGQVEGIDEEAGALIIDGVIVQVDLAALPPDIINAAPVQVNGSLADDGTVSSASVITASSADNTLEGCESSHSRCHPVLTILSDAYDISYNDLEHWHQDGLGVGEIARVLALAEATGTAPTVLITDREGGMSWGELMKLYPDIVPQDLAQGIDIRQGEPPSPPQSHREDNPAGQNNGQGGNPNAGGNPPENPGNSGQNNGNPPENPGNSGQNSDNTGPPPHANGNGQGNK